MSHLVEVTIIMFQQQLLLIPTGYYDFLKELLISCLSTKHETFLCF